ncbi:hypothetical protein PMIN06_011807 [Paraphaeosphaeria minitans]|uniref:Carboxymuconolactone decarboxylase-like domain-containing protein n=1 Tax=Paraphaeosphaeria minitans TaxID=565426 RepID=A0A9P6GHN5_9PLEO|nr:hypothetical protein PMIN01_05802 [Paraphaeosphaeria minitans]
MGSEQKEHENAPEARFPVVAASALSAAQKPVHDHIAQVSEFVFGAEPPFEWTDKEGGLIGPYPVLLYTPSTGTGFFDHAIKLGTDTRLPIRVKEFAILAVGGHFDAAYENYAHTRLAKLIGLRDDQVADALAGREAQDSAPGEVAAFRLALAMVGGKGPVGESVWKGVRESFSREQSAALVFLISSYAYVAMALNAAGAPAPASVMPE